MSKKKKPKQIEYKFKRKATTYLFVIEFDQESNHAQLVKTQRSQLDTPVERIVQLLGLPVIEREIDEALKIQGLKADRISV